MTQQQLIEEAKMGRQYAFRQIYDQNVDNLFSFLYQFEKDRTVVSDWVQLAFIKAFTKIASFRADASFKTWLFQIGINEMKMDLRKWGKEIAISKTDLAPLENQYDEHPLDLADKITLKDQINKLDSVKRMVLMLYEIEGYSHKEIAKMMNIKESHSRTILTRAKRELRTILKEN